MFIYDISSFFIGEKKSIQRKIQDSFQIELGRYVGNAASVTQVRFGFAACREAITINVRKKAGQLMCERPNEEKKIFRGRLNHY